MKLGSKGVEIIWWPPEYWKNRLWGWRGESPIYWWAVWIGPVEIRHTKEDYI